MNIENELREINFRMDLLRENTELSLYLYDSNIKEQQWISITQYFSMLEDMIRKEERVHRETYERQIYSLIDLERVDGEFAKTIARLFDSSEEGRKIYLELY